MIPDYRLPGCEVRCSLRQGGINGRALSPKRKSGKFHSLATAAAPTVSTATAVMAQGWLCLKIDAKGKEEMRFVSRGRRHTGERESVVQCRSS